MMKICIHLVNLQQHVVRELSLRRQICFGTFTYFPFSN